MCSTGEPGHDSVTATSGSSGDESSRRAAPVWHRVAPHLASLYYVPDYLGAAEEVALLREVRASRAKWVQLSGRRLQNHGGVVHAKGLIPAPLPSWLQPLLSRLAAEQPPPPPSPPLPLPVPASPALAAPAEVDQQRQQQQLGPQPPQSGAASTSAPLAPPPAAPTSTQPAPTGPTPSATSPGPSSLYGGRPPNHVLVNSYMPGEGIMPHEDGPAYHPVVAILSLGAPAVLRFTRKKRRQEEAGAETGAEGAKGAEGAGAAASPAAGQQEQQRQHQGEEEGGGRGGNGGSSGDRNDSGGGSGGDGGGSTSGGYEASVLLLPRSLVVFSEEAFTDCLHSIQEVHEELIDESVANLHCLGAPGAGGGGCSNSCSNGEGAGGGEEGARGTGGAGAAAGEPQEPPRAPQAAAPAPGLAVGSRLPRGGERISLTVRRVAKVMPSILRPR